MNELQLKLCDIQGRLFELSADNSYESSTFIKVFMTSDVAKALDSTYNRMQWAGEEYLLEELTAIKGNNLIKKGEIYSKDILYWIGYLYRYWHFYKNESSVKIYKQAVLRDMHTCFLERKIKNRRNLRWKSGKSFLQKQQMKL